MVRGLSQAGEMPLQGILRQLGFDGKSGLLAIKRTPILRRPNFGFSWDTTRQWYQLSLYAARSIFFCRRQMFET